MSSSSVYVQHNRVIEGLAGTAFNRGEDVVVHRKGNLGRAGTVAALLVTGQSPGRLRPRSLIGCVGRGSTPWKPWCQVEQIDGTGDSTESAETGHQET